MMRKWIFSVSILLLLFCVAVPLRAEVVTLEEARELYKAGEYEKAAPVFAKELKRKPKNGSYNHWYGVCLYEMGQYKECIPYLKKGVERKVLLSNFYLGEAYLADYRFADAIEAYEAYITAAKKDKKEPIEVVYANLAQAKLGARMIGGVERVQIIDSISVDSTSFFEAYRLSPEAGSLVNADKLPIELSSDTPVVAFIPQRRDMIFMGYPMNGNDYDLCQSNSLIGGQWSELQSLSATLNTTDNQSFPFLLSDGQTLYYAQDGEASLGGYDIFITRFSSEREDYMLPQNVGMPFNSLYNDFMMAIDETTGVGWFVTDRNHIVGQLTVYLFIPNEMKEIYEGLSDEEIQTLARITSIKNTWREGADYSQLLAHIAEMEKTDVQKPQREFTFVLCEGIIYTGSQDFQNADALRYYQQARNAAEQLQEWQEQLHAMRLAYAQGSQAERSKMQQSILDLEAKVEAALGKPAEYEKRARNAELSFRNMIQD